jgi:hypothetical protein
MSRNIIFVLMCHPRKLLGIIYILFVCSLETRSSEGMNLAHSLQRAPFLLTEYLAKGLRDIAEC